MNDSASKLITEAVLRVLHKNPEDLPFYLEQISDASKSEGYRTAIREALDEWMRLQEASKCSGTGPRH